MNKDETLKLLIEGIKKSIKNTDELLSEAKLLLQHNHYSRAYFLAQIANEESAKIELLGISYIQVLLDRKFDEKQAKVKFRSHEVKNNVNSYHVPLTDEEEEALRLKEPEKLSKIIDKQKVTYSKSRNTLKNDSLYVGWDVGFSTPGEKFNENNVTALLTEVQNIFLDRKRLPEILKRSAGKKDIDALNSFIASLENMKSFVEYLPHRPKSN